MSQTPPPIINRFQTLYGKAPSAVASAPGRLEVLGNHTDYNCGLALSCAVSMRCYAAVSLSDQPVVRLASTAFDCAVDAYPLDAAAAPRGHWANYVLGLVDALRALGVDVHGFAMLIDSQVPRSAGVSSSAALEMAALVALSDLMDLDLTPIELAWIGRSAESQTVGAQTGMLDQMTSLLGRRDQLLKIDFESLEYQTIALPAGYCFVAIDSGVKHDLTGSYNVLRDACEAAAGAMGVASLRAATMDRLDASRRAMGEKAWRCARHVISENARVDEAVAALKCGDLKKLGALMFASHASSRDDLGNSCDELDEIVEIARADARCLGARLSGGGFGGITIHLVQESDAEGYRRDILDRLASGGRAGRWSAVCAIDDGASLL